MRSCSAGLCGLASSLTLLCCLPGAALAVDDAAPQPAAAAARAAAAAKAGEAGGKPEQRSSWNAPAVMHSTVTSTRPLREEERIGDYAQPRWTAVRRFPTTSLYVVPAGNLQLEYRLESKLDVDRPEDVRTRSIYEAEIGLGHRLQLDVYLATEQHGHDQPILLRREQLELRYALADWGVLPGNPTIYAELIRQSAGPMAGELKLLLGGELAPRWHWGSNLIVERTFGLGFEHEYALTLAISRTLIDGVFSLGAEVKGELVDAQDRRFDPLAYEWLAGPSLQWCPVPQMHLDLVLLFGAETELGLGDAEDEVTWLAQPILIVGWEF